MPVRTHDPDPNDTSCRRPARHRCILAGVVGVVAASLVAGAPASAVGSERAAASGDPAVVVEWHAIAESALVSDTATTVPEDWLYLGFVQAAVYNAVVGIEGGYELYRFDGRPRRGASSDAAAAAAAHRVLVTYLPDAQEATLDAALVTTLAGIPDGAAKTRGIAFGELAADTLLAQREDDGRGAAVAFDTPPAPGVWRPTLPAFAPFAVPWMGGVTPLMVRSGAQFGDPGPPPAMTSARYTRDFDEVKALGSVGSTARTAEQTDTARFFSGNAFPQLNAALRHQVAARQLDSVDAARMFAAVDMSVADAVISIWYAKYHYGFWRPITAIQLADTDGNPATAPDPSWLPLGVNPPYPDYVSGYSGVAGAFAAALTGVLGTKDLRLSLTSTAVPGVTRTYDSGRSLRADVVDARVWLGIHFRFADTVGDHMGAQVAKWALARNFRPV